MTVTRQLVSRELRCPAIAGVQAAQPLLTHELARGLEEVWIVRRRVVCHIRQDRRLRATGRVRPGRVVVPSEFDEQPVQMAVIDRLDIAQQFVGKGAVEAFHDRVLPRTLVANPDMLDALVINGGFFFGRSGGLRTRLSLQG